MNEPNMEKNRKIYLYTLIIVSLLLLLPLLRIAFFDHPSADDYGVSAWVYRVYKETHSIPMMLKQVVDNDIWMYNNWQGLYTSVFIQSMQPAIFGERYYGLTAFIIIASIWGANYIFAYYVLCVRCGCDKLRTFAVTSVMSMVMTQYMPSAVEGMYWFNGAMNYTLYYSTIILILTLCISFTVANEKKLVIKIILASILAFLLSGVNYVMVLEGLMVEVLFIAACIFMKNKRGTIGGIIVFVFGLIGFIVNASAPGVKNRQGLYEGMGPGKAIFESIRQGTMLINGYWGWITIFFLLLIIPSMVILAKTVIANTKLQFKYPLIVLFISFMFLCAMFTPPLYGMGYVNEGRILDAVYLSSITVLFFDCFYFIGYWLKRESVHNENGKGITIESIIPKNTLNKSVGMIAVIVLFAACIVNSWSYKATVSLVTGEAKQYEGEMYQRYKLLMEADEEVVLPVIKTKPELLFLSEIAESPDTWPNTDLENYFEVDKIYLETYFK